MALSAVPWSPQSTSLRKALRWALQKFPAIRQYAPMPLLDGPLPIPDADSDAKRTMVHAQLLPSDPYAYMQDHHDKRTIKYANKERQHFDMISVRHNMDHGKGRIQLEFDAKILVTSREGGYDLGEERIGDYLYFSRELDDGAIGFFRKRVGDTDLLGDELINPSLLMQHFGYRSAKVGVCRVSSDGSFIAYTLAVEDNDRFICHIKSVDNNSLFHVLVGSNIVSIEFGSANSFFYTECNEVNRPYRVMRQEIVPGILPPPTEVYREDDESFFVEVRKTKDGQYLIMSSDNRSSGSVHVAPSSFPIIPAALKPLFPRGPVQIAAKSTWSWVEHYHGHFIRVTTDENDRHEVLYIREEVALREGTQAVWKVLIPHRDDARIVDIDLFEGRLVLFEQTTRFERVFQIRVVDLSKGLDDAARPTQRADDSVLHLPPLSTLTPGLNRNFDQSTMSFLVSNVVTPVKDCVYDFKAKFTQEQSRIVATTALYTQRQSDIFTPWDYMWPYAMYRDVAESHDGEQIPITICHQRDAFVEEYTDFEPLCGEPKPCLLYVYGSYGEYVSLHFQIAPYLWLLRRRWTVAFAHVRGGGEQVGWAAAGKGRQKMNTVRDFIACCEHMVAAGYTTPAKLVVAGHSAGCVPIAAAANMRGDTLFSLALMRAPFVDIANTMLNPDLPLTMAERQDWGDPTSSADDLAYLLKYDPYANINDRVNYPSMFVSAAMDDDRVPYWNALKYVAKLREQRRKKSVDPYKHPLVLRLASSGGHHVWNELDMIGEELVFLCQMFDLEGPGKLLTDMDTMTQVSNLHRTGVIDHDDQEQVFLKWDNWEREKSDYQRKLLSMSFEPNYRKMDTHKQTPYFWIPSEEELEEQVNRARREYEEKLKQERQRSNDESGKDSGKPKR